MNDLFNGEFMITNYLILPRSMLKLGLNATEMEVYMLLLDRAKLSAQNSGWRDEAENVYLYYTIRSLADAMGRKESAVKAALLGLERRDLIIRRRQGYTKPNRLYVKVPRDEPSDEVRRRKLSPEKEAWDRLAREPAPSGSRTHDRRIPTG